MNLYTINQNLANLLSALEEQGGELLGDQLDSYLRLSQDAEAECVDLIRQVLNLESHQRELKMEIGNLKTQHQVNETRIDGIKAAVAMFRFQHNLGGIDNPLFRVSIQQGAQRVTITDLDAIPERFMILKPPPPPVPNLNAISNAIKAGESISGAELERGEPYLAIRRAKQQTDPTQE